MVKIKTQTTHITPAVGEKKATFVFAHGAGKGYDSEFMTVVANGLANHGIEVVKFNFSYMDIVKRTGKFRPPHAMNMLKGEYFNVIRTLDIDYEKLVIGGKSMGGRVATLVARDLEDKGMSFAGLVAFGYPFHKPKQEDVFPPAEDDLRIRPLLDIQTQMLICQGARDIFGWYDEVVEWDLSDKIEYVWLEDGDHDFKPRVASGFGMHQNWQHAIDMAAKFIIQQTN